MAEQTIEVREVNESGDDTAGRYEVFDTDTGISIGIYDTKAEAESRADQMRSIDVEALNQDASVPRDDSNVS
ncbi:hypothetical protein GCM10027040_31720 [Halomonas shantousis]